MLESLAVTFLSALRVLSLANLRGLFRTKHLRHLFMEWYVLCFAILLTILINFSNTRSHTIAFVAAYAIIDIISYRLFFIVVKSKKEPWSADILRRSLLMTWLNLYELIVGFGILYVYSGQVKQGTAILADPLSAAYFSTITMMTVGYGDFVPVGQGARVLVCCQLVAGLIMLAFIVPALLALFSSSGPERIPSATLERSSNE